jgi:hypothetical protein
MQRLWRIKGRRIIGPLQQQAAAPVVTRWLSIAPKLLMTPRPLCKHFKKQGNDFVK